MRPLTYQRSPQIIHMLRRTEEIAWSLPKDPEADNDCFPPAFIEDGPELDRALKSLGLKLDRAAIEPGRLRRGAERVTFAVAAARCLSAFALVVTAFLLWGAVLWVLSSLSALGGAK